VFFKENSLVKNPSAGWDFTEGPCPSQAINTERLGRAKTICLLIVLLFISPQEGQGIEPSSVPPPAESSSLLSIGIEGYQKFLSPVLDSKCYMLPSCSAYAKQALSEYGPFLGLLMTIDRLFREANEDQTSPLVRQGDNIKLYDPPSANVWWK
jgi:putative component of membrane protein insertase Oxa1/YidC/SpoIIIJ protein YidD